MKSNYKQLGQFIRQVDVRNTEEKEKNLLEVSGMYVNCPFLTTLYFEKSVPTVLAIEGINCF